MSNLWIRSQDRTKWIEVKNSISVAEYYCTYSARFYGLNDYAVYIDEQLVGTYSSREKAEKVVNDIIEWSDKLIQMQIPADEEVEVDE